MIDQLSATFAALADPTRRALLDRLSRGDASIGELAEPFDLTTRAISKHVAVLESAGLVTRSRDAQKRPSHIRIEPLVDIDLWLQSYRRLWTGRFARLSVELEKQQEQDNEPS
ncbi:ArsR/SmtB family transcription factor [Rhizobium sp. LjRoot254]|uniref:ArsR/SmtB family transcription factor n=1 Tax=Rhizobium sp. LjRoot254 TaxID=3342297 RepID=UPI003ECC3265